MTSEEKVRLEEITNRLRRILAGESVEPIPLQKGEDASLGALTEQVNRICREFAAIARAARDLAEGELETEITAESPPGKAFRAFQATARRLVWQTKQIAKGDFSQKVDFLGDFSDSFNKMTRELGESRRKIEDQLAELERLAGTDSLTQAKNHRFFVDNVNEELKRLRRYGQSLSIILLDIDHFKRVNDTLGHSAGDRALRAVADGCQARLREVDTFCRVGGEEFAVIMPATGLEEAVTTAERLREAIEELQIVDRISLTASFGVAEGVAEDTVDTLFGRADRALYQAKHAGRNRVAVPSQEES